MLLCRGVNGNVELGGVCMGAWGHGGHGGGSGNGPFYCIWIACMCRLELHACMAMRVGCVQCDYAKMRKIVILKATCIFNGATYAGARPGEMRLS